MPAIPTSLSLQQVLAIPVTSEPTVGKGVAVEANGKLPLSVIPVRGVFSAYRTTSAQSVTQNSWTKVEFNAEEVDVDSWFDSTTNYRFTPKIPGYYLLTAMIGWGSLPANTRILHAVYKNGSEVRRLSGGVTDATSDEYAWGGSCVVSANGSTDYFEVFVNHADTGARTVRDGSNRTYFQGYLLRQDEVT